jgi:hypothetical protein
VTLVDFEPLDRADQPSAWMMSKNRDYSRAAAVERQAL